MQPVSASPSCRDWPWTETDEAIAVVDLAERVPPRLIAIAWYRDRRLTHAAEAFVEAARELCARLEVTSLAA